MVIIRAHSFKECIIFTPLPAKFHIDGSLDDPSFTALENRIHSWMGNVVNFLIVQCS